MPLYSGNDLKRVRSENDDFGGRGYWIKKAVEVLTLTDHSDLEEEEFSELQQIEDFDGKVEPSMEEEDCNIEMFGPPTYYQGNDEYDHSRPLLFQFTDGGGDAIVYIQIDKNNLMNRKYDKVYLDHQM